MPALFAAPAPVPRTLRRARSICHRPPCIRATAQTGEAHVLAARRLRRAGDVHAAREALSHVRPAERIDSIFVVEDSRVSAAEMLAEGPTAKGAASILSAILSAGCLHPSAFAAVLRVANGAARIARDAAQRAAASSVARATFDAMLAGDVAPDHVCMTALIGVCIYSQRIEDAEWYVRKACSRFGFKHTSSSGSALLVAFSRAGRTKDAALLVDELRGMDITPDERSYTAFVTGLARAGRHSDALTALEGALRMPGSRNLAPLFGAVLESCSGTGDARTARRVVNAMRSVNFVPPGGVVRNVLGAAIRGGDPALAEMVLFCGKNEFASKYVPDRDDYSRMIASCSRAALPPTRRKQEARRLFDRIRTDSDVVLDVGHYNVLIATLGRIGAVAEARFVLENEMDAADIKPNIVSYNSLINACVNAADPYLALEILHRMSTSGVPPNQITYNTLLNLAAENDAVQVLSIVLNELRRDPDAGLEPQVVSSMLKLYRRTRDVDAARKVVWALHRQQGRQPHGRGHVRLDSVVFCSLLTILLENRCEREAVTLFGFLLVQKIGGTGSFNVVMQHFGVRHGDCDKALQLLVFMKRIQIAPDSKTYTIAIKAATADRRLQTAFRLLGEMQDVGLGCADTFAWTAVISACGKAGRWEQALELLNQMRGTGGDSTRYTPPPTIAAYNAALYAVGMADDGWKRARELFGLLLEDHRVQPDEVTFSAMASIILRNRFSVNEVEIVRLVEGELEKEVVRLRDGHDASTRRKKRWSVSGTVGKPTGRPGAAKKVAGKLKRIRWVLRDIENRLGPGAGS